MMEFLFIWTFFRVLEAWGCPLQTYVWNELPLLGESSCFCTSLIVFLLSNSYTLIVSRTTNKLIIVSFWGRPFMQIAILIVSAQLIVNCNVFLLSIGELEKPSWWQFEWGVLHSVGWSVSSEHSQEGQEVHPSPPLQMFGRGPAPVWRTNERYAEWRRRVRGEVDRKNQ